jgi:hypothetical protein
LTVFGHGDEPDDDRTAVPVRRGGQHGFL